MSARRGTILFRCDGYPEIGLGHVMRCLALADELQELHGFPISFAMRQGPVGIDIVQRRGYPVLLPCGGSGSFDYAGWLSDAIESCAARALVLDVRDDLTRGMVEALRDQEVLTVVLDDPGDRRLGADLAFYPPVPQVRRMDWTGFRGELFTGFEWLVLHREFSQRFSVAPRTGLSILVTMGGSDPAGLTLMALEALDELDKDFETTVVLGPGFMHRKPLEDMLSRVKRPYDVRQSVSDMALLMSKADLALASFGMSAYELAAMGVPALYLCLSPDHLESSSALTQVGAGISLGLFSDVTAGSIKEAVERWIENPVIRLQMAQQARGALDGRGAARIARLILDRLDEPLSRQAG